MSFLRRALLKFEKLWRVRAFALHCAFWGNDVRLGKNVVIGRRVAAQTSRGGRIVIGDNTSVEDGVSLEAKSGILQIGADGFIGCGVQMVAHQAIEIGHSALIAAYCIIRDADHGIAPGATMRTQVQTFAPVRIGNDVWLGTHSVVTAGSNIGDGAVIGANAVVTHDIGAGAIAVGVPARTIRTRGEIALKIGEETDA